MSKGPKRKSWLSPLAAAPPANSKDMQRTVNADAPKRFNLTQGAGALFGSDKLR